MSDHDAAPCAAVHQRRRCDASAFACGTTAALDEPEPAFGQSRALDAVRLALDIAEPRCSLVVVGEPDSGRYTLLG